MIIAQESQGEFVHTGGGALPYSFGDFYRRHDFAAVNAQFQRPADMIFQAGVAICPYGRPHGDQFFCLLVHVRSPWTKADIIPILPPQKDFIFSIIAFLSSSGASFMLPHGHMAIIFSQQSFIFFLSSSDIPLKNPCIIEPNIFSIFLSSLSFSC
jgi:hypothetical protein